MEEKGPSGHIIIKYSTFVLVWAGLILLTWLTVTVAKMKMGSLSIISPFIIATLKASLVVAFFMHLRYERGIFKVFLMVALCTIVVLTWLVYTDVLYR